MSKKETALRVIREQGLLPLYFHPAEQVSAGILKALYRAGIRAVEYTNRGAEALANFRALVQVRDRELPGLLLGIGTIKTPESVQQFSDAGADFIISPAMIPGVAEAMQHSDLLWVPGCMTPTEIAAAEQAGVSLVKIFPGNILGPGFVSAVRELFPGLLFMPTGGVEAEASNLGAWFHSGVCAVGMGSKLISRQLTDAEDYAAIEKNTAEALDMIRPFLKKP